MEMVWNFKYAKREFFYKHEYPQYPLPYAVKCMFLSRVWCFQILVVTGLLPLLAVYVKQWSGWSTVD